jgi:hypothetical protein
VGIRIRIARENACGHVPHLKVVFGIEYEKGGSDTRPEIAQSLAFLDRVAAEIAE